jgi:hypothetical protein
MHRLIAAAQGLARSGPLIQQVFCALCVACTLFMIYAPLWQGSKHQYLRSVPSSIASDEGMRISYACVLAGAASLVLDYMLDLANVVMGSTSKGSKERLVTGVIVLFVVFWPSLHLFSVSHPLAIVQLLHDSIMQKYVGTVLIVYFLQNLEKEHRWPWYCVIGIVGNLSLGVILHMTRVHMHLGVRYFVAACCLEGLSSQAFEIGRNYQCADMLQYLNELLQIFVCMFMLLCFLALVRILLL